MAELRVVCRAMTSGCETWSGRARPMLRRFPERGQRQRQQIETGSPTPLSPIGTLRLTAPALLSRSVKVRLNPETLAFKF